MANDPADSIIKELEEEPHSFELIVGDETGEILNGDVPVRWCVTPELVSKLEKAEVFDAHVLLVTATEDGREMDRKIVPITELMTYVRFTRAGTMKIYGFIVSGRSGRKDLYQTYKRKELGVYVTDVVCEYTEKPYDDIKYEYSRTEVDVVIPPGVFGKEPGPWMKWYVNLWHSSGGRIVDECHYRRRLIIAFTLKWLPVLIYAGAMVFARMFLLTAFAGAGFYKGAKWSRVFRPFKWNSLRYHLIDDLDGESSFILHRSYTNRWNGVKTEVPLFFTIPFFPTLLAAEAAVTGLVFALNTPPGLTVLHTIIVMTITFFTMAALVDIVWFLKDVLVNTKIFDGFGSRISKRFNKITDFIYKYKKIKYLIWVAYALLAVVAILAAITWMVFAIYGLPVVALVFLSIFFGDKIFERFENIYTVSPENNDYTEIRELLCPKDDLNLQADIDFIPSKQRTVRLWYLEMKHKICKPMQQ